MTEEIAYGPVESPLGPLLGAVSRRGVLMLAYVLDDDPDALLEELTGRVASRTVDAPARLDPLRMQLDQYFEGERRRFDVPLDRTLVGPFTRRVLDATARIPYGETASYAEVAEMAGSPRGQRAAGNALARNPWALLVPCHRVIRSDGAIGGYGGRIERKRFLLALESAADAPVARGARS